MATQPGKAKARINRKAKQAIGHIDKLLKARKPLPDLQPRLKKVKNHLEKIASDPHEW